MTGLRTILVIFGALFALPAVAGQEPSLFPTNVISAGGGASFAERLDEPPLWSAGSDAQTPQRIRLFIGGHTVASWSIRLDQSRDGRWTGYFRHNDGRRVGRVQRFKVTSTDLTELGVLIDKAKLWKVYPQFWVADEPNEICIDGMTVILERMNAAGYRYSEGNAQCSMGQAQLAVAAKLMRMAGRADLERLLR